MAWFSLGQAQSRLNNDEGAVEAFDQVSPSSQLRAVQLAPNDVSVLSNYAEFLLASGRDQQAMLTALQAASTRTPKAPGAPTFEQR